MGMNLSSSVNGIQSALTKNNVRSNNIANVNSKGYKSRRAVQSDSGTGGPEVKSVIVDVSQGNLKKTRIDLDISIEGEGYFAVESKGGKPLYTRSLSLQINSNGQITDNNGNKIPGLNVNLESNRDILVEQDGTVVVRNEDGGTTKVGKLMVMNFRNPQGLLSRGNGYYEATPSTGTVVENNEHVRIIQGAQEGSNVDLAEQITGQMADEAQVKANAQAIKTQDEMLGDVIDLQG